MSYWCDSCDRGFVSWRAREQHYENSSHHHYCSWCEEDFDDEQSYDEHISSNHEECDLCDMIFETDDDLHEHRCDEHDGFYCSDCRRMFSSERALEQHREKSNVHGVLKHRCPYNCAERFISVANLFLHLEAGACPDGMTREELFRIVARSRGSDAIIPPDVDEDSIISEYDSSDIYYEAGYYRCPACSKRAKTKQPIKAHLRSPTHAPKIYMCPERYGGCGTRFIGLGSLFQHMIDAGDVKLRDVLGPIKRQIRREL